VAWTGHGRALELAQCERALAVGAHVAEGVERATFATAIRSPPTSNAASSPSATSTESVTVTNSPILRSFPQCAGTQALPHESASSEQGVTLRGRSLTIGGRRRPTLGRTTESRRRRSTTAVRSARGTSGSRDRSRFSPLRTTTFATAGALRDIRLDIPVVSVASIGSRRAAVERGRRRGRHPRRYESPTAAAERRTLEAPALRARGEEHR